MRNSERWETRQATPDDVLAHLRGKLRHDAALDIEVDGDAPLTFETRLSRWMDDEDILPDWKSLSGWLEAWLDIELSPLELRAALHPRRKHTVRELCELIAPRWQRPVLAPLRVAGMSCATAGAFLTLRTAMIRAGLPVVRARPSSALAFQTWEQWRTFLDVIALLAPGVLPPLKGPVALPRAGGYTVLGGVVSMTLGWLLMWPPVLLLGGALTLGGLIALGRTPWRRADSVSFPGITTLGDVARALCAPVPST